MPALDFIQAHKIDVFSSKNTRGSDVLLDRPRQFRCIILILSMLAELMVVC